LTERNTTPDKGGDVYNELQDGRSRTLPGVLHIFGFERNMISINKMSDVGVHTLFRRINVKLSGEIWY
jgi:hypothetical protein